MQPQGQRPIFTSVNHVKGKSQASNVPPLIDSDGERLGLRLHNILDTAVQQLTAPCEDFSAHVQQNGGYQFDHWTAPNATRT